MPRKSQKKTHRQVRLLLSGVVALAIVAMAVSAILLSANPGDQESGTLEQPFVGSDLHSLAVDPNTPDRVVVGGHEGGAVSDDGGKTWTQASGIEGADAMGWVIDPRDPSKMYVSGHYGFYRSEDGGKNFDQDNSGLPDTDVHGLGMDPKNPDTLYAYVVDHGIYRSTDAGGSWEPLSHEAGIMGPILVDPRNSDTLYVSSMQGGFRESADGGKTWHTVAPVPGMVMSIAQDQNKPDTFYAASGNGILKSTDGGKSWHPLGNGLPPSSVSAVAASPSEPRVVYAGVLEGTEASVYRSEDGGATWRARN